MRALNVCMFISSATGFKAPLVMTTGRSTALYTSARGPEEQHPRKSFLVHALASLAATASLANVASAEFYEKGEELQGPLFVSDRAEKVRENFITLKESLPALKSLEGSLTDYGVIRATLRVPPLAGIRVATRNIITYLDQPARVNAEGAYSPFITSLELLDRQASLLLNGRAKDDKQLVTAYGKSVSYLEKLVAAVAESPALAAAAQ